MVHECADRTGRTCVHLLHGTSPGPRPRHACGDSAGSMNFWDRPIVTRDSLASGQIRDEKPTGKCTLEATCNHAHIKVLYKLT